MKLGIAIVAALMLSTSAEAGEILRLKATGPMATENFATLMSAPVNETGMFIVQWKGQVTEAEKAAVQQAGLKLLSYVPDDAFIAQGDGSAAAAAAKLAFVNAVVPYGAGMKIEPELNRNGIFGLHDQRMVSLQMAPGADLAAIRGLFEKSVVAGDLVIGPTANLWELASRADVVWVERYLPVKNFSIKASDLGVMDAAQPSGSRTGFESGTRIMKMDVAYDAGFTGRGQIVAFADTGLDSGDLNTLMQDFRGQVKSGHAMGLGGSSWGDPHNHGTHVAGSIAGTGGASGGLMRGAGYGAQLVAQGMWSDIFNNILPPGINKLFDVAYQQGARLHSDSWGAPNSNGRYDNMAVQTDTWLFQNMDFLAVFAAGNDGADMNKDGVADEGSVSSPGSSKNVLTVGASKNFLLEGGIQKKISETGLGKDKFTAEPLFSSKLSEDPRGMAVFSSRGPTQDGRIKPEVVAPGTNIVSVRSKHTKAKPEDSWGVYDENYLFMGGTSMATPLTSGAMAVIRQYLAEKTGSANVSAALLKATVANTAEDLFPGQFGAIAKGQEQPTRRPNNHEGWGRVNLENLVGDNSLSFYDERTGLATGQEKALTVNVAAGKSLRVTMAYTDAPGAAAASKTLVNDLDLKVIDASGRVLYPNHRTSKDGTNNMETVDVLNAPAGSYQVVVSGASVPQGKNGAQPYALVISTR